MKVPARQSSNHRKGAWALWLALNILVSSAAFAANDLLPDIIVRTADLYDHDIVTNVVPGRTHLRVSNGTANIGDGPLWLYGASIFVGNTQDVNQYILRDDESAWSRTAGRFIYHPGHGHIHFENWSIFRIREVGPNDSVGAILGTGDKISFCIIDLGVYTTALPNFNPDGQFFQCRSTTQGISVGWVDVYSKDLPGQNIDVTDIPDGEYWLESEVDPDNNVLELDETNNVSRIKVNIGQPAPIAADLYEPNDSLAQVMARVVGAPRSPNLGPCAPSLSISGLSLHENFTDDYFRFYSPATGTLGDFVRISFSNSAGDLDLWLLNSAGVRVDRSDGVSDVEEISLNGTPEGWFWVRVFGYQGGTNPSYTLDIDPPQNGAPSITVTAPPVSGATAMHSTEAYTVRWSYSDPENDSCWVNVFANRTSTFDGAEYLFPTSVNKQADQEFYVINSAYLDTGAYWIACRISDGGTVSEDWSPGVIRFIEGPGCLRGDADNSGSHDVGDVTYLIDYIFSGGAPPGSVFSGDLDLNGEVNIGDATYLIAYIFLGGSPPSCD